MVNIQTVANQIRGDVLYNTIFFKIKEVLQSDNPRPEEVEKLILEDRRLLAEYKEINRFSEISNIQIKELSEDETETQERKGFKTRINGNIQRLRELENFEVDSSKSAYSIWVGSAGTMVVFLLHNIFALFTELYTTHTFLVYGIFSVIIFLTYWAYRGLKENHENQHLLYKGLYHETQELIELGVMRDYFTWNDLYRS